ncbi:bifunctional lysylphosphatidylglycerol flippase/synthetase MprF [Enterococcus ratti]|uniref:bifunctional lysylphosphatidylglycerol flippase/synthetase MprF n=1 Tax=Enterococcus ratti TaxID=150033 RepID=UPI0008FFF0B0|nr:bifunctional lysylphosphatidylglycerol flippase/synthetase MprF [Enterococcus ratti]
MLKQTLQWVKNHLGLFKTIFLISVIVIIISELIRIGKTLSAEQLAATFETIPVWKTVLMLLIGLLSVLPMIGYDIILNQLLGQKPKKNYLFETSWLINTINNVAGFGGFVSIGLRSELYGHKKNSKQLMQALSKIFLFLMAGLSIYSLISFFMVFFTPVSPFIKQYWIWLIGGGLYFPIVFLVTTLKKDGYIGGLSLKTQCQLLFVSVLEWSGVLFTFLAVGSLMDINVDLWQTIPLFIAASVIGIVSMIPGEIGSFDIMMIIGLSAIGVPKETVVVWILLYRVFYYIIPFLIGIIFFFKTIGSTFDQRYSGIPKQLATELAHKIVVILLYFSGIMLVLSATIPQAFTEFRWLHSLNPLRLHLIMQFPSILLGFLFVIMGRGIAARVKRAYWPTISLIFLACAYVTIIDFSITAIIFLLVLLLIVFASKNELFREQIIYSWEWLTIDGGIIGALSLLYIIIGVYNLPTFPHRKHYFISFFLFPSEKIWLSGLLAIIAVSFIIILFVRFLQGKKQQVGETFNEEKASTLLNTFGGNSDSQLIFLKDKRMFIYEKDQVETVMLQFSCYNNKCIVMGDPSGKKEDFPAAIEAFIEETDRLCYLPVFYETSEEMVMILHEFGYDFIKMGEEAYVNLNHFTTSGKKMKGTRAVLNRIEREGFTFDVLQPPFSAEQMVIFKTISDNWLGSRKEKGFSLGFFSEDYLQRAPIAVVKNDQEEIVAFATIMPTYTNNQIGTIDLMRYDPKKAPSGSMDFLFLHLFNYMKEKKIHWFNLGMAPLSNVGTSRKSFLQERIAYLVYEFGSHFYSFHGLREYKSKYATNWVSRYTLYSRSSWIAYVMIALLIIDNASVEPSSNKRRGLKRWIRRK